MDHVGFDDEREAFVVEPGATLLPILRLPAHRLGRDPARRRLLRHGGRGALLRGRVRRSSRPHGIVSDHIHAVEVVTVDERGEVRAVVATRDPDDPDHADLAWAVAGGGRSTFGVVTRFWMRSRGAEGGPGDLLPKAPSPVLCTFAAWSWGDITQEGFASFMSAYADWSKEHGSLDSPSVSSGTGSSSSTRRRACST
ncbi:Aclacinomycin-N/aclacinomycin-A oxidase [Streptomyces griseoloalbus]